MNKNPNNISDEASNLSKEVELYLEQNPHLTAEIQKQIRKEAKLQEQEDEASRNHEYFLEVIRAAKFTTKEIIDLSKYIEDLNILNKEDGESLVKSHLEKFKEFYTQSANTQNKEFIGRLNNVREDLSKLNSSFKNLSIPQDASSDISQIKTVIDKFKIILDKLDKDKLDPIEFEKQILDKLLEKVKGATKIVQIHNNSGGGLAALPINRIPGVNITSPQNDDVLAFDSNTQTWINEPLSELGLTIGEPINGADPNLVLFADEDRNLNQDPRFIYDRTTGDFFIKTPMLDFDLLRVTNSSFRIGTDTISIELDGNTGIGTFDIEDTEFHSESINFWNLDVSAQYAQFTPDHTFIYADIYRAFLADTSDGAVRVQIGDTANDNFGNAVDVNDANRYIQIGDSAGNYTYMDTANFFYSILLQSREVLQAYYDGDYLHAFIGDGDFNISGTYTSWNDETGIVNTNAYGGATFTDLNNGLTYLSASNTNFFAGGNSIYATDTNINMDINSSLFANNFVSSAGDGEWNVTDLGTSGNAKLIGVNPINYGGMWWGDRNGDFDNSYMTLDLGILGTPEQFEFYGSVGINGNAHVYNDLTVDGAFSQASLDVTDIVFTTYGTTTTVGATNRYLYFNGGSGTSDVSFDSGVIPDGALMIVGDLSGAASANPINIRADGGGGTVIYGSAPYCAITKNRQAFLIQKMFGGSGSGVYMVVGEAGTTPFGLNSWNTTLTGASPIVNSSGAGTDLPWTISGYIEVLAITAGSLALVLDYTDAGGTARTITIPTTSAVGTMVATGRYTFPTTTVYAKGANTLTLRTTFAGTSISYNIYGSVGPSP